MKLSDLSDVSLPNTLTPNTQYAFTWINNGWLLSQIDPSSNSKGTQYIVDVNENIFVGRKFQYIVHDCFYVDGVVDIEGQLVIF